VDQVDGLGLGDRDAKGHRSQADGRNGKIAAAELTVFHEILLWGFAG